MSIEDVFRVFIRTGRALGSLMILYSMYAIGKDEAAQAAAKLFKDETTSR
ncbi:hypothetical protein G3I44_14320 [Halogeometricum borinquense]|uniref:Uncharacterized protein n=1 Tax=Halogeometricum borinquense TaxID=60847 RepID=A0A6C0ULW6_9EURY|nr:hypothetical protein [Halogeometricum borinquense]QIB75361.1 hypothetical protein G3I44_14320 [Halogeometricum borinquense]